MIVRQGYAKVVFERSNITDKGFGKKASVYVPVVNVQRPINKTITLATIAAKMTVDPAKPCFVLCVTIDIAPTNVGSVIAIKLYCDWNAFTVASRASSNE